MKHEVVELEVAVDERDPVVAPVLPQLCRPPAGVAQWF